MAKRTTTAADWQQLGIAAKVGHEWSAANDFLVESSEFTDELDYLLIDDVGPNGTHLFMEVDYGADRELVQVPPAPPTPGMP